MRLPFKLSIATKLLIVITGILLSATVPLSFKSASLFRDVSMKREEGANLSHAYAKAHEISIILQNLRDRASTISSMILYAQKQNLYIIDDVLNSTFQNDTETLSLSFYKTGKEGVQKVKEFINGKALSQSGLKDNYLLAVNKKFPIPTNNILNGEYIILNRSINKKMPILTVGIPLFKNSKGQVNFFVTSDLKQSLFQKSFAELSERKSYLVNKNGIVLAHYDESFVIKRKNLSNTKIVSMAVRSKLARGASSYLNPMNNKNYFAAYSKTQFSPVIITEIPESIILEPSLMIRREVFYVTGMILSVAFLIVFLFSLTLTKPIILLSKIARAIGQGKFNIPVVRLVNSSDEVGNLAHSVQSMLSGLIERDKAKSILNKFHGSSIAEDLLSSAKIERQGVRKDVAILFCDIRGFTSMSEKMQPEDVVLMLNDYLNRMVNIIMKNNGVIDKFIGDAIMAVWGAPQKTGTEAHDAVKAALEMRKELVNFNNDRISKNLNPVKFGIGLHYGPCVSGIIGSEERLEYSVIGDTVNLCSRIESVTKTRGVDTLVSSTVKNMVSDKFIFEEVESVTVKGKEKPISIFKINGYIDNTGNPVIIETPYSSYPIES